MLSILSGCLGENGLGNDSHFRNIFDIDIPKDMPSNRETSLPIILSTSQGMADYAYRTFVINLFEWASARFEA